MTNKRIIIQVLVLILILALLPTAGVFADGGGGFFYGLQTSEYPFLKGYPIRNNSLGLMCSGGYGYGVHGHEITGGFGVGLTDFEKNTGIAGGYGGVIRGLRLLAFPFNLMLTSWTGIGGLKINKPATGEEQGFLIVSEEVDLEVGLPVLPWFMPTLYAGYQIAGNIYPDKAFAAFFSYTQVVGVRLAWGKFY